MTAPTPRQVLDTPMRDNDAGAETVRGYLVELLARLWDVGEGFSGKRPFGDSGWEFELFQALAAAGMIEATLDEEGYLDELSRAEEKTARELIAAAIDHLGEPHGDNTQGGLINA